MVKVEQSFYFIRHGQTDYNLELRAQGQMDTPLNTVGIEQARAAVKYFNDLDIDVIVSSPLQRALETAKIINKKLNVKMETDIGLMERNLGDFQGRLFKELCQEHDIFMEDRIKLPTPEGAETFDEFKLRAVRAVSRVVQKYKGKKVLIASHGGVFISLCEALCHTKNRSENCVPYEFRNNEGGWDLNRISK